MSTQGFTKPYANKERLDRAVGNHALLLHLVPEHVPALLTVNPGDCCATWARAPGGPVASTRDLFEAGAVLGRLQHRWAQTRKRLVHRLHRAAAAERRDLFRRRWHDLRDRQSPLAGADLEYVWTLVELAGTGLYKDANATNFLMQTGRVTLVDFDTLTAAPPGYDLAKLLMTWAMRAEATLTLDLLQRLAARFDGARGVAPGALSAALLILFCDLHWVLTYPYAEQHGYRRPWPAIRSRLEAAEFGPPEPLLEALVRSLEVS